MENDHRLEQFCTAFTDLDDVEKDHILGISKAFAFAAQKPKSDKNADARVTEYERKP
jgi:hypothetical protein